MHDYLWGKQRGVSGTYPLISHLLDTATFATVLWDHWLRDGLKDLMIKDLGPDARAYVAAAAGLHDVGKANPSFQGQENVGKSKVQPWMTQMRARLANEGLSPAGSPVTANLMSMHQQASAAHLTTTSGTGRRLGLSSNDTINSDWLAATSLGHHGQFLLPDPARMRALRSDRATWKPVRDDLTDAVLTAVGLTPGAPWPEATPTVTILISGLVVIADRLASDAATVVSPGQRLMSRKVLSTSQGSSWLATRYATFLTILKDRLGIYQPMTDPVAQILEGHTPRGVQSEVDSAGDGLWVVMAPTGAGKTEAAMLRHGSSRERLIFCLPTMATTNAMANRVAKMFQATPNVAALEHSMRDLFDVRELGRETEADCSGFIPSDFLSQGSNRLLGPVSVGTIDQVLLGSLSNRFTHLRLLSIANAHVVIDEAHLMDQYQTHLAENLFKWWGATGTKVTVLTATLPTWQRNKLKNAYYPPEEGAPVPEPVTFPSHEGENAAGPVDAARYLVEITKKAVAHPPEEHVRWVNEKRSEFPNARLGVVVNTVARAQEIAAQLVIEGEDVVLLHSRMTAKHRNRQAALLERKAGKRRRGKRFVVVGTQVVEASLDIDLDAISTDSAPASSLVQRAGRVWRHYDPVSRARRVPGLRNLTMHVVSGMGPTHALPYFHTELDRVSNYLVNRDYLVMPDDSQGFVEASAFDLMHNFGGEFRERDERRKAISEACKVIAPIDQLIQPIGIYGDLSRMTDSDDREALTRLVKPPTASIIVLAPARAGIPGSWTRSVAELESLSDRSMAGKALEGMIPVNGAIAAYVIENQCTFNPKSAVLRDKIPVVVNTGRLKYSKTEGLYLSPKK